jgi:hypothetical protein
MNAPLPPDSAAVGTLLKVQPQTVKSALPPADAAQANDGGAPDEVHAEKKKATRKHKAKADPAPASPANEPAAPVKPPDLNLRPAWPFPFPTEAA